MAPFKSVLRKRRGYTLTMLYIAAVIDGLGRAARSMPPCVGLVVKWFPDWRGLAVGLRRLQRRRSSRIRRCC